MTIEQKLPVRTSDNPLDSLATTVERKYGQAITRRELLETFGKLGFVSAALLAGLSSDGNSEADKKLYAEIMKYRRLIELTPEVEQRVQTKLHEAINSPFTVDTPIVYPPKDGKVRSIYFAEGEDGNASELVTVHKEGIPTTRVIFYGPTSDGADRDMDYWKDYFNRQMDKGVMLAIPVIVGAKNYFKLNYPYMRKKQSLANKVVRSLETKFSPPEEHFLATHIVNLAEKPGGFIFNNPAIILRSFEALYHNNPRLRGIPAEMIGVSLSGSLCMELYTLWQYFDLPQLEQCSLYSPAFDLLDEDILRMALLYRQSPDWYTIHKVFVGVIQETIDHYRNESVKYLHLDGQNKDPFDNLDLIFSTANIDLIQKMQEVLMLSSPGRVMKTVSDMGGKMPDIPLRIVYSANDSVVPPKQTEDLLEDLKKRHVPVQVRRLPWPLGHYYNPFFSVEATRSDEGIRRVLENISQLITVL